VHGALWKPRRDDGKSVELIEENPLEEMKWLLGKWKGEGMFDSKKCSSSLRITRFSENILEYNEKLTSNNIEIFQEQGYFFLNSLYNKVNQIAVYSEGFINIYDLKISSDKGELFEVNQLINQKNDNSTQNDEIIQLITGIFSDGYNIPPNIEIIKYLFVKKDKRRFISIIRIGKNQQEYTRMNYKKE